MISCSSSDSNSSANQDNSLLYRKWYFVSSTSNSTTYNGQTCTNNGHRDYLDFISPNTANFYYIQSGYANICSDDYALEPYTFTKKGNIINFTYASPSVYDPFTITISELTATSLTFVKTWDTGSELSVYRSY